MKVLNQKEKIERILEERGFESPKVLRLKERKNKPWGFTFLGQSISVSLGVNLREAEEIAASL